MAKAWTETPEWFEYTQSVRRRNGGICEFCSIRRGSQVHHRIYRGYGGQEDMRDLMHLCDTCHKAIHKGSRSLHVGKGSRAARGDNGKTLSHQKPGHWLGGSNG